MTRRGRVLSFGGAIAAMVAGAIAGAIVGGITGEAVGIAFVSVGAIAVVSLIFLEVGLSEDREREREAREARRAGRRPPLRRRRR
jgi:predicted MFS family arabinose efflux permease